MTFTVGDFLRIEGEITGADADGGDVEVRRFHRVTLTGESADFSFDATPLYFAEPPWNEERESLVRIKAGNIESKTSDHVELKPGKEALVWFHYPNPLTPHGRGYWMRFKMLRLKAGPLRVYRLKDWDLYYRNGTEISPDTRWWKRELIEDQQLTVEQLVAERYAVDIDGDPTAIQECTLFEHPNALLVDVVQHYPITKAEFCVSAGPRASAGSKNSLWARTELKIPKAADDKPSPVNITPLGVHDRLNLLSRPLGTSAALSMTCAARKDDPSSWCVDWEEVPTQDAQGRLSFSALWQMITGQHGLGLKTLNSRSSLSFFPTDIRAVDEKETPWTVRYAVANRDRQWSARVISIGTKGSHVRLRMGLAEDVSGAQLQVAAHLSSPKEQQPEITDAGVPDYLISLTANPPGAATLNGGPNLEHGKILIGGVLLELEGLQPNGSLQVARRPPGYLAAPPIDLDVLLGFQSKPLVAASEDPERGFELDGAWLGRERPLVLDMSGPSSPTRTVVVERATSTESRSIQILVYADAIPAFDVVVLDTSPMRVARVIVDGKKGTADPIATFRDDAENPMRWDFATNTGELDLILPPQTIGEEMIKGKLTVRNGSHWDAVPLVGELFDFRLSPPAWLRVDRTAIQTARAQAPWSLRRILNRREGEVGLELLEASFELFYGLAATIGPRNGNDPNRLRIADREALLGSIPFPSDLVNWLKKPGPVGAYATGTAGWIRGLLYHPAELPIFRDWSDREQLVINRRVGFGLRETRQTAHPFRLEDLNPEAKDLDAHGGFTGLKPDLERFPLRGGVDYGFESPNVYDSLRNPSKVDSPEKSTGTLAGLSFGTLGGSGCQEAPFDEGRTLIITKTTQGRLDGVTIVRVGRIAMLWNHARHVIVYERSTRTAPRYAGDQPKEFEGLAALRKVKEYIEITQPQRAYPDIAGSARQSGPLVGSFFETTIIPVRPEWGHDVAEGFVMRLAGPLPPGLAPYYPRPNIFLELARAPQKGGKVSQLVENPENLTFFTSTRRGEGSDPDTWRARADIDFPVTGRPRPPEVRYLPSFPGAKQQPDALSCDYGQSRFTVNLVPAEEAANLMHGRPGDGIEARVRGVSLARGAPPVTLPGTTIAERLGKPLGEAEAQIADTLREVAMNVSAFAKADPNQPIAAAPGLRDAGLALIEGVERRIQDLRKNVLNQEDALGDPEQAWHRLQSQLHAASAAPWTTHLQELFDKNLPSVLGDAAGRLGDVPGAAQKEEARSRLSVALDVTRTQTLERVGNFAFVPQQALDRLRASIGTHPFKLEEAGSIPAEIVSVIQDLGRGWVVLLRDLEARYKTEEPANLDAELHETLRKSAALAERRLNDMARTVKDALGPLFQDLGLESAKGPQRHILDGIAEVADAFISWIEAVDEGAIPPFELGTPDWDELRTTVDPAFLADVVREQFEGLAKDLEAPFAAAVSMWTAEIDRQRSEIEKKIGDAKAQLKELIEQSPGELQEKGKHLLATLRNDIDGAGQGLRKLLDPSDAGKFFDKIRNEIAKAPGDWLKDVIQPPKLEAVFKTDLEQQTAQLRSLLEKGEGGVESLRQAVEKTTGDVLGSLRNLGERVERSAADELRGVMEGAADGALEMVRTLARGPVTDTLATTREWVGYYYDAGQEALKMTRAAALFNDLGPNVLNGLSTQLPVDRIRDRLLPQLANFDLNKMLPDFAGMKLEHLFKGVKIPEDPLGEYDWIKLRHGFDKHRLMAWSEVAINRQFGEGLEVFRLDPLGLSVRKPRFKADSRIDIGADRKVTQRTSGSLSADWVVDLNGEPMLTISDGGLKFDETGHLNFDFKPSDLRIAAALQFLTDALAEFFSPVDGLTITPVAPGGVRAELTLPIPDIGTGAFTMTGITLYSHFDLLVAGGFEVGTGLWLSRPERPFGLAILFLGGGGWFGVDVRYRPPEVFETRVSVGIAAGAMAGVNLGVAHGSVGLLFTVGIDFYRNWSTGGSGDTVISIGLLMWGEFSILGIASAYLRLVLRIEYRNGAMTGYGRVTVRIKICWCFTLSVDQSVQKSFSGGSRQQTLAVPAKERTESVKQAVESDLRNSDW